jgi:hypothetical protein
VLERKSIISLLVMVITFTSLHPINGATKSSPLANPPLIVLSTALNSIPSDGVSHPSFFITLTQDENIFIPTQPVNITLSCSDERILTIPKWVIVSSGSYYTIINASSTVQEKKSVEVSVSASDFLSSKLVVKIEPPTGTPIGLEVTLLPDILEPKVGASSEVVITIVDIYGKPAKARENLTVILSSNNLRSADVDPKSIEIPEGSYSGTAKVISNGYVGSAVISASTSNLKPDFATAKVSGAKPEKVAGWAPSKLLLGESARIYLSIVDSNNKPAKTPVAVTLNLYSSDTSKVTVSKSATIKQGEWMTYAEIIANSTGSVTLYVASEGLTPFTTIVSVVPSSGNATAIKVFSLAGFFATDEKMSTVLAVQLVDSQGFPVLNKDRIVSIFSSSVNVLDTQNTISTEENCSVSYVNASLKSPGTVIVSAYSGDLLSGQTSVNVYSPTTTALGILAPPIPAEGDVDLCIISTNTGTPAPMGEDTYILLSSSNTQVLNPDSSITISKSSYYKIIKIRAGASGDATVSAQGSGLPSTSVKLTVVEVKPSVFKIMYVSPTNLNKFPLIIQTVSSQGSPIICDTPVSIRVASSNTSVITFSDSFTIPEGSSDYLLYGLSKLQGQSAITFSSGGFSSSTMNIKSSVFIYSFSLSSESKGSLGSTVKITATVVYNNAPLQGATIRWTGKELLTNTSITDESGKSINFVTLKDPINLVEAETNLPQIGVVSDKKQIAGLNMVNLKVNSSLGIEVKGSGSYAEGDKVDLEAPPEVSLSGILDILGIHYVFKEWRGDLQSKLSNASLTIPNSAENLNVEAFYEADYSGLIIRIGVVIGVIIVGSMVVVMIRRRSG